MTLVEGAVVLFVLCYLAGRECRVCGRSLPATGECWGCRYDEVTDGR